MIQWFPGHMMKAKREIEEKIHQVDLVIELLDARIPQSSQNPFIQDILKKKEKIIVLMKKDLADDRRTNLWLERFGKEGLTALAINANDQTDVKKLIDTVYRLGMKAQEKMKEKGVNTRPIRALIVGVPNVGKSTLINRLANKKIAKIGDRPGITKMQQWIKVGNKFELLDTPGILWPKFDTEEIGLKLATIGTIKYELTPEQDLAAFLIQYLLSHYEASFLQRYPIDEREDMWLIFEEIGRYRGALESGGQVNFDKVAEIVLRDFRTGKLGKISLE